MPFRQYHTSMFWSTEIIWKLPPSQTQVMTEFILKDEVILPSLISVSPPAALLLYLWSCLQILIFGLKMGVIPSPRTSLLPWTYSVWCYRKGKNVFSLNNRKCCLCSHLFLQSREVQHSSACHSGFWLTDFTQGYRQCWFSWRNLEE